MRRPKPRRKKLKPEAGYNEEHREHLLRGYSGLGRGFGKDAPDDVLQQAWVDLKAELLPTFIAEFPGARPWAWWRFDAP